nr:ATP-citrate synthase alpha chain protein 2 [Ipomoea batatas]GMC67080.1 ATP-citrate synthase alpha chain protein 2 [Ipomoea batatas]GMD81090.1 ATP-citrate synthase alpha chain protein 2 [Ipomoea batatas]
MKSDNASRIHSLTSFNLRRSFNVAAKILKRRAGAGAAIGSGGGFKASKQDSSCNFSRALINHQFMPPIVLHGAVFNRSRSVKMSSRVLVDVVFEVFDRDSWNRSSESLSAALVPLCVVILVNMTASEGSIATMCDRFLEEEFPENDQLESLEKSNFNADLNAGEQENDDDLFADVSFRNSNGKEHESDIFSGKSTTTDLKRRFFESDAFGIGRFSRGRPPLESITTQFPSILRLECDVQIGSMDRRTVLLRFATEDECKRTWIRGQAEVDGVHFLSSAMVALRILDLVVLSLSLSCGAVGVRCRWHGVGDMARKKIREYDSKRLLKDHLKHLYGIDLQICSAQVTESTDFVELTNKEPWLSSTKLVVKPDMLFGKCGKNGLVALKLDLLEVAEFVKAHLGVEVEMGGCKAPITIFIVEPFPVDMRGT